jgi:hypothetical protein
VKLEDFLTKLPTSDDSGARSKSGNIGRADQIDTQEMWFRALGRAVLPGWLLPMSAANLFLVEEFARRRGNDL